MEICICAAIKLPSGEIFRGQRHGDAMKAANDWGKLVAIPAENQGFITSKNRFVTREEGRKLQDAAGIKSVNPEGYMGDTLFSEDLY